MIGEEAKGHFDVSTSQGTLEAAIARSSERGKEEVPSSPQSQLCSSRIVKWFISVGDPLTLPCLSTVAIGNKFQAMKSNHKGARALRDLY